MRNRHTNYRRFDCKKEIGLRSPVYPPEERFKPEFIEEVKQASQDIKSGKGIKFKSVSDLFSQLKE
nr:DUF2683 family protein [uncultured Methanolobus sp.]